MMRIGGCSSTWGLSNNLDVQDAAQCQGGAKARIEKVVILETKEARLSSLRDNPRFSLLATHVITVRKISGDTCVQYGWLGRVKSIIIDTVEYQERGGKIQKYELDQG